MARRATAWIATSIRVRVETTGDRLRLSVAGDGAGGADPSRANQGTVLSVELPLDVG